MSSTIASNTSMISSTIQIPKIAQDTMSGIRSPPQYVFCNVHNLRTHSRKSSKDFTITTIHEEK